MFIYLHTSPQPGVIRLWRIGQNNKIADNEVNQQIDNAGDGSSKLVHQCNKYNLYSGACSAMNEARRPTHVGAILV